MVAIGLQEPQQDFSSPDKYEDHHREVSRRAVVRNVSGGG